MRFGGDWDRVVDWSIDENTPYETYKERLLWGTHGIKGDQPLEFRPLSSLSVDHLQAIYTTQIQLTGKILVVIEDLIMERGQTPNEEARQKEINKNFPISETIS